METVANENIEDLKKKLSKLEFENTNLKDELLAVQNSLYLTTHHRQTQLLSRYIKSGRN
jgi:hypothetical protein